MKRVAILIPTYKRFDDLIYTLDNTPIDSRAKFIIVANLEDDQLDYLKNNYAEKSILIDERTYGKLGGCKAYNLAYDIALKHNFDYAILYADDVIPFDENWLDLIFKNFIEKEGKLGIFSTDECHHGSFGWNIIVDCPIAHFFIIDCQVESILFNPLYKQYVIDFEIAVRLKHRDVRIDLLPIKLKHLRSGLHRDYAEQNFNDDVKVLVEKYPQYKTAFLQLEHHYYLPHSTEVINFKDYNKLKLKPWPQHKVVENSILNRFKNMLKEFKLINSYTEKSNI
ncbi:hypothetical protein WG947_06550 [Pontibacter sp. H259]|uniref:glycosyltransferase family 2 protein n=1 Tax=Pontibacter sp. H259 TaxID=3133421 RepID=UPI0030C159D4